MRFSFRNILSIGVILGTCFNSCGYLIANAQQGDGRALKERVKTSEDGCVLALRTVNTAQVTYRGGNENKGFARTLRELGPKREGILEAVITSGKKDGYRFQLTPERTDPDKPVQHYILTAGPMKRLVKRQRSFFTDETGVIRFTTEKRMATRADPPLDMPSH